ncbi:hypothetical protein GCM10010279_04790 [Streptomyces mutabilis]|nr:hypothetical protein GCM10010279_04790 [Streptomyces mutabilis]
MPGPVPRTAGHPARGAGNGASNHEKPHPATNPHLDGEAPHPHPHPAERYAPGEHPRNRDGTAGSPR